jgi:hypothetical protein
MEGHISAIVLGLNSGQDGNLRFNQETGLRAPFRLVFCKDLSLGVVTYDFDIDKASKIEPLRPEHRHVGDLNGEHELWP